MPKPISTIHPGFLIVLAAFALGAGSTFSILVTRGQEIDTSDNGGIPQECLIDKEDKKDVLRQIKKFRNEIKTATKEAAKADRQTDLPKLQELDQFAANATISIQNFTPSEDNCWNEFTREVWWQIDPWAAISDVRACTQLPQQIKDIEKNIKELEREIKNNTRKMMKIGLDPAPLQSLLPAMEQALAEVKQIATTDDCRAAQDKIREINQTIDPVIVSRALENTVNALDKTRQIPNEELRLAFEEILSPIKEQFLKGEYQDVYKMWHETDSTFWDALHRAVSIRGRAPTSFTNQFSKLQTLFEKLGEKIEKPVSISPSHPPTSTTKNLTPAELQQTCVAAGFLPPPITAVPTPPPVIISP